MCCKLTTARLLRHNEQLFPTPLCHIHLRVTVTLIDGLVLARSAFHHSMNYRSVVIFGKASVVEDEEEKRAALQAFTEHVLPRRWNDVRSPTKNELNATRVLSLPLKEASAKIRAGGPVDDAEDYEIDVWAGVIPLKLIAGDAIKDSRLRANVNIPDYVKCYQRPFEKY